MTRPFDSLLLFSRSIDLLRIGVHWGGATVETLGGDLILVAGPQARITLTFPPQAIAEHSLNVGIPGVRMAGPSRVTFAMPDGSRLPLTTEGLLGGLSSGTLAAAGATDDGSGTVLEVPTGLFLTVATADVKPPITATPSTSAAGRTGLWQMALNQPERSVQLSVLDMRDVGLSNPVALTDDQRRQILRAATPVSAMVALGALGITMDAELASNAFHWTHRIAQGRDQQVVVESKGVLYPFGHRARAVSISERAIDDAPGAPAAIRTANYLIVDEPVRSTPRDDFRFTEVEILTRRLGYADETNPIKRPVPDIDLPQVHEQESLDAEQEQINVRIDELQRGLESPISNLALLGDPDAGEYGAREQRIAEITVELESLPGDADWRDVKALNDERAALNKLQIEAWPRIKQALAGYQAELRGLYDRTKAVRQRWTELKNEIAAIRDALSRPPVVAFWPGIGVQKLSFDVRLKTPRGDLTVQMPLMFVRDVTTVGDPVWPDFSSLNDPDIARSLGQQWTREEAGTAKLPGGVAFDLVQDVAPQPGDVHEIHSLLIEAVRGAQTFAPRVAQFEAKIASLRALLPDQEKLVELVYNKAADAVDSPLVPKLPIVIDFLSRADRSGGLVAPKYSADALSRTLGPVARSVLDKAQLPDFSAIYKETKLLGLALGDLIDGVRAGTKIPGGPTIVPVLEGVHPVGVRFEWKEVPLKAAGIFRPRVSDGADPTAPCDLDLQVRVVGEDSTTAATVRNFALALPPDDTLITLSFRSLQMVQSKGKPPAVHIEGFDFELAGALKLLRELQEEVLGYLTGHNPGVVVRRTPNGIAAGYAFTLPEVSAGVFMMRNMGVSIDVAIPFDDNPVQITLGFARPDNQFVLAVTIFGGGGYFLITMGHSGVQAVDLQLTFGAFVSVSFLVAKGEVHAYGAVQLKLANGETTFSATLRLGGSVDVLGIVSVAVELVLQLTYNSQENLLSGRATLVIEVHLLFFSRSVKLDSGEWILAGSRRPTARLAARLTGQPLPPPEAEAEWHSYWQAFAA